MNIWPWMPPTIANKSQQRLQQHRIRLQWKTDHFTYVWITTFVIDYMHHIAIDCSSAMKLLLFSGFDFTFCRACVCLPDYVCTLNALCVDMHCGRCLLPYSICICIGIGIVIGMCARARQCFCMHC